MKKLFFIFAVLLLSSCINTYKLSNFNSVGIIKNKVKTKNHESGNFIYKVWINPEIKVKMFSSENFEVGDTIYLKSLIIVETFNEFPRIK